METALGILVAVTGFVGVLVGQVFVRGREVREMRRSAYVEWVRAARNLSSWVGEEPKPGQRVEVPHPDRLQRLNDCTAELGVVASRLVLEQAEAYMQVFKTQFGGQQAQIKSPRDVIDILEGPMQPYRHRLLRAMRRDLLPWWRLGALSLTVDPDAGSVHLDEQPDPLRVLRVHPHGLTAAEAAPKLYGATTGKQKMKSNTEKARRRFDRLVAEGLATRDESDPEHDRLGHHVAGRADVVVRYRAAPG